MISYIPKHGKALAEEIAKLVPLTLLVIAVTNPGFFDLDRIFGNISLIPSLAGSILTYLLFIVGLEMLLRIIDFFLILTGVNPLELEEED